MPNGKPAGVRCIQLDAHNQCTIFGQPERPAVCHQFTAEASICGDDFEQAMTIITELERLT